MDKTYVSSAAKPGLQVAKREEGTHESAAQTKIHGDLRLRLFLRLFVLAAS